MISELAIKKIKGNNIIMGKLMIALDRGERTINNWLDDNDYRLTTAAALKVIKSETGLTEKQILVSTTTA